jgi:hypothetical protein
MSYEQTPRKIIEWRPGQGDVVFIDEIEKALGPMPELKENDEQIQPQI